MTYIYFLIGQLGYDIGRDSRHGAANVGIEKNKAVDSFEKKGNK